MVVTLKILFHQPARFKKAKGGGVLEDENGNPVPAVRPDGSPLGEWNSVEISEPNIEARMGAIYALERIAQDSERDHWPIMETLTAYIRNNTAKPMTEADARAVMSENKEKFSPGHRWTSAIPPPRPDLQAAIRVVGRRSAARVAGEQAQQPKHRLDLRSVCLQHAEISNAQLSHALLLGARLEGASLHRTNLRHADLTGANFEEADLSGSDLQGACLITAPMRTANLFEANGKDAMFDFALLRGANFEAAELEGASFHDAQLDDAKFPGAQAASANFHRARLRNADFSWADLRGASFVHANLMLAHFGNAELRGADLTGANLIGVNFETAKNLTEDQLSKAFLGQDIIWDKQGVENPHYRELEALQRWRHWLEERGGLTTPRS